MFYYRKADIKYYWINMQILDFVVLYANIGLYANYGIKT